MQARYLQLLQQYDAGEASAAQVQELLRLAEGREEETEAYLLSTEARTALTADEKEIIWQRIQEQITPVRKINWKAWLAAAAMIVLLVMAGIWNNKKQEQTKPDIVEAPRQNRAVITLADGSTIPLDSLNSGVLAKQEDVSIVKTGEGKLQYQGASTQLMYNTLSNPRGSRVVDMTLADGTQVWLNAGSSITFPVAFTGNTREVEIKGEAFLEVAASKSKPFAVKTGDIKTLVLGTSFNVNNYADEPEARITLVTGKIKVEKGNEQLVLKAGEAATSHASPAVAPKEQRRASEAIASKSLSLDRDADLQEATAWLNNKFQFEGSNLEQVLRQFSRWYNVDVVYEGKPQQQHFRGGISRDVPAQKVLTMLEATGAVKFEWRGRRLIVKQP